VEILIAEDDLVSRKLLKATLEKWGYDVVACADGKEAWDIIQKGDAPKLLILDWMMPEIDGVELCSRLRKMQSTEYQYIILLTARVQKEDVVTGLDAGADDYITKPFDKQELQVRLRAGRRILDLQEQLLLAQDKLREQAIHDPLTGLLNRRAIQERLENELSRIRRENIPISVVMLDLDRFKNVNDTYGHMAGDFVLRQVSSRMVSVIRDYDTVGRYGGEEFFLIFPGCDQKMVVDLSERIRSSIADIPMNTSEGVFSITASLGTATLIDSVEITPDDLIAAADAALYKAKDNGRNRIESAPLFN
jgi:diguanylate cyclase (GGDEF)-like protein